MLARYITGAGVLRAQPLAPHVNQPRSQHAFGTTRVAMTNDDDGNADGNDDGNNADDGAGVISWSPFRGAGSATDGPS